MDPILLELQKKSCGLSVNGLFLGALSHADDIRTLSTNLSDCKQQIVAVSTFASEAQKSVRQSSVHRIQDS